MRKIRIAWVCHFSNKEVRAKLDCTLSPLEKLMRKILRRKVSFRNSDYAPWIANLIREFEVFGNVDLHIIAPCPDLSRSVRKFEINGVHYHFFRSNRLFPLEVLANKTLSEKRTYSHNRKLVNKLVEDIRPDIINLIGAENPYYSSTLMDIVDIPIFVSAQTVYSNPDRLKLTGELSELRWRTEVKIHRKETYFGCTGRMHRDLILKNNPKAIIFKMAFPIQLPANIREVAKKYDFVCFAAGIERKKGIEDSIKALAIVKTHKVDVTLNIVGACATSYKELLQQQIADLDLSENVSFNDYFSLHADMHQHIMRSRFALLPNMLDVISGTVIEAMVLGLPLVTYKTTGTPYLNRVRKSVLIADIGDIKSLSDHMICLLDGPILAGQLKANAQLTIKETFDNTSSAKRLLADYYAVLNHYNNGVPIPEELLFDINEFPIY